MKKFLQEFKDFALKGNVVDMAVGVIIATKFNAIVSSLVSWISSSIPGLQNADGELTNSAIFLNAIIDFIICAFILFLVVKAINSAKKKFEKPAEPVVEAAPEPSDEAKLLAEIKEILEKKN